MKLNLPGLARYLAVPVALLASLRPACAQDQVIDLTPRPGVTLRYLALPPAGTPKAAVILFTGNQGVANIPDRPGRTWAQNGAFVVRAREHFRAHGLFVAVIDAPSDRKSEGLGAYRIAPGHADDIAAVIADLRHRANVPVWLVGTSRGTISAANAAARLKPPRAADGLVLTSTVTRRSGGARPRPGVVEMVYDLDLAAIRIPTLIVAHSADICAVTPPADAAELQRSLTNAPRTAIIAMDGGDPPRSEPCEALSAHGFLGREAETVKAIAEWILAAKN